MATKSQSTVGTELYILDNRASPAVVLKVPQLKGISPTAGGKRKKIDTSNMDSKGYDENQGGRAAPPEAVGELVLDMTNAAHQAIKAIFELGAAGTLGTIQYYVGQADGNGLPPTVVTGVLTPPQATTKWARSGYLASGYVATFQPKFVDNDVIRADFGFQLSGGAVFSNKGDPIATTY